MKQVAFQPSVQDDEFSEPIGKGMTIGAYTYPSTIGMNIIRDESSSPDRDPSPIIVHQKHMHAGHYHQNRHDDQVELSHINKGRKKSSFMVD